MRAMNSTISERYPGLTPIWNSFRKNRAHYLQEAIGLGIFMISACFFSAMLEGKDSAIHMAIPNGMIRLLTMGLLMGITALFIFYSPLTAPSGSHINPAVTLVFLRLGKICPWDAFFYMLFQLTGGLVAVYLMSSLLGHALTDQPVNYATTVPGRPGIIAAALMEGAIAFVMITMVLFTSDSERFKKNTRIIAGCLVCCNVIFAGPVSGFGMNPARTLASAIPAHTYTSLWIYLLMPFAGMLGATEFFLFVKNKQRHIRNRRILREYLMNKTMIK
jgi:aquaporin Z